MRQISGEESNATKTAGAGGVHFGLCRELENRTESVVLMSVAETGKCCSIQHYTDRSLERLTR